MPVEVSEEMKTRIQRFMREYQFTSYAIDEAHGDLVMVDHGEEFVIREYKPKSQIRMEWERLEAEIFVETDERGNPNVKP